MFCLLLWLFKVIRLSKTSFYMTRLPLFFITVNDWEHQYTPDLGSCYSYNLPKDLQELQVQEIKVQVKKAVNIYSNHRSQFLSPDSKTRVVVSPGESHNVDVFYIVSNNNLHKFNLPNCFSTVIYMKKYAYKLRLNIKGQIRCNFETK